MSSGIGGRPKEFMIKYNQAQVSPRLLECIDFRQVFSMKKPLIYIFMMHNADILRNNNQLIAFSMSDELMLHDFVEEKCLHASLPPITDASRNKKGIILKHFNAIKEFFLNGISLCTRRKTRHDK